MKRKILTCLLLAFVLFFVGKTDAFAYWVDNHALQSSMTIAEIQDGPAYRDSGASLYMNPERGFYETSLLDLAPSGQTNTWTKTKADHSKLLYLKVDLSAFSGNMNEDGQHKWLTWEAVQALRLTLEKIEQNDNTVILRFVYDGGAASPIEGKEKTEPSQDFLLDHITTLGPTFRDYATTIDAIQVGFYGLWGEAFHNTDADEKPEYYQQTVGRLIEVTAGTDITIAVRTPEYYSWYRGIAIDTIEDDITLRAEDAYRVGIFNDAYGASANDMGTYLDREKETNWLARQAAHTFYGGEAIVDTGTGGIGTYNAPDYFIDEAYKIHASYLNWEWNTLLHEQWKAMEYAGVSAYDYINEHLGYRFVLRGVRHGSDIPAFRDPQGRFGVYRNDTSAFTLEVMVGNTGFGNVIKAKKAEVLIVRPSGELLQDPVEVMLDARDIPSQGILRTTIEVPIAEGLPYKGDYKVFLRLSSGEELDDGTLHSAIAFANIDPEAEESVYAEELQANLLTVLRVNEGEDDVPADPWRNFAVYSATDESLRFYRRIAEEVPTSGTTNWDGAGREATAVYTGFEKETSGQLVENAPWRGHAATVKTVTVEDVGIQPLSTAFWFGNFEVLETADMAKLDTSKTRNMESMFNACVKLRTVDMTGWDTSEVVRMHGLLTWCTDLITVYVGEGWSTAKVPDTDIILQSWGTSLRGGAGTKYPGAATPVHKDYACIDGGSTAPGYFTKKL